MRAAASDGGPVGSPMLDLNQARQAYGRIRGGYRMALVRVTCRSAKGREGRFRWVSGQPSEMFAERVARSAPGLLPARNVAHVGQVVGDALVAVDAGLLAGEQEALMGDRGARRLPGDVHRFRAVAVAAFQRIVGLEARPFVQRELKPVIEEFLARIDGAERSGPRPPSKPASCARSCRSSYAARGSPGSWRARRSDWRSGS